MQFKRNVHKIKKNVTNTNLIIIILQNYIIKTNKNEWS